MSGPQQTLKLPCNATCPHCGSNPQPPAMVQCEQCRKNWCCSECCVEDDNMDHEHFDMISDHQRDLPPRPFHESLRDPNKKYREHPPIWGIICATCSGKPLSYHDRPDEQFIASNQLSQ